LAEGDEEPKGSSPVGHRVTLPRGAQPPYEVFLSGVLQREGADYHVAAGRQIVFNRMLYKEGRLAWWRWAAITIGLFGTYRRNDVVDVQFRRGGKVEFASDLEIHE
jgi:hypothetical protein